MKAPPDHCASCGSPAEPDQEYCLDCGARIVPVRRVGAVGRAWERHLGRYPGDWVLVSGLLLLVAAGSAAGGIVGGRDTGGAAGAETIVATSPVVRAPVAPPAPTTTQKAPPVPTPKPKPTPAPKPPGTPAAWPDRDGYTVVLASIPARGTGLAEATARAKLALSRGIRGVGVLTSARYASLHPGYYVVFAGVYDSLADAQTAAGRAKPAFPNAYARQVTR